MHRDQIQKALEAAHDLSNHYEFVIAGSLSVLGLLESPPASMSMSIDIDFYPLRDPGRAGDIAEVLGEGSPFHDHNGFYLDAISPMLPTLPDGWEDRLVKRELGGVTAYFLDVNDTAISKYARGEENDFRWLEAGYDAGIFNMNSITARLERATSFFNQSEKAAALSRHRMHLLAMEPTGQLDHDLLGFLHANSLESAITAIDDEAGMYCGKILWTSDKFVVQSLGRGVTAIHCSSTWTSLPEVGQAATLKYRDGIPGISTRKQERSGPSLG